MNLVTETTMPQQDLKSMRAKARALQNKVDAFEELLDLFVLQEEEKTTRTIEVFIQEVRELMTYLQEKGREGGKVDLTDRNYLVLKWGIEESLRDIEQ